MMLRRLLILLLGATLVLSLAGCAGLPTSGSVQAGGSATSDDDEPSFDYRPVEPQEGASPEQIVDGFITAASSPEGSAADGSWAVARSFLAVDYRSSWNPQASVVVDVLADRQYTVADDGTVTLQVTPVATVDSAGTYTATDGGTTPLTYRLAQQDDGQWRIVEAPAGLVMDEDLFSNVFHSYEVMYFDPTWTYLVPDVRWFPTLNAAGRIATALVNGEPATWLAESVASAFPSSVTLTPAVPVDDGVAQAELSEQALTLDDQTLNRMQTQLAASLATAGVTSVQMLVDGTVLNATTVTTASTKVDATRGPLVLSTSGFGFLSSGALTTVAGLSDAIVALSPTAIETAADLQSAAVLAGGQAIRVSADGVSTVVDARADLIAPTLDPFGSVWSVPSSSPSEVMVANAGVSTRITGAWAGATRISSMQISRDGTRMAAVLSYGANTVLAVAGVIRDTQGVATALGEPEVLAQLPSGGIAVGWLDDSSVGVISVGTANTFVDAPVGGAADTLSVPGTPVSVAGSNVADSARLLTADGSLYVRRSSTWVQTATGVSVLAIQQGTATG